MKKLDWTAVTASNGLVFEEQTFEHINNGHKDSYIAFVKANIPSAWHTGKLVILYGCVDSGTHPARNLSAGAVYYNGEIYQVDSASFTTTGLQIGIWTLTDVDSGTDESTIKTATSSFAEHVLVNSKFVFAAGLSGSGTFNEDSSDVVRFSEYNFIETTSNNGGTVTASSAITITGLTNYYSYYIDKNICHLDFDIEFTVTSGAVISYIRIPLPTGITKKITGTSARYTQKGHAIIIAPTGTTNYTNLYVNSCDDVTDGQYLQIKRSSEGDTDITLSTVSTTLRGHISFRIV